MSEPNPNQTRWKPFHIPAVEDKKKDFLDVSTFNSKFLGK